MSPSSSPTPLWRRSFDKLRMSADDGARLLWLDFGGEDGEIVSDVRQKICLLIAFIKRSKISALSSSLKIRYHSDIRLKITFHVKIVERSPFLGTLSLSKLLEE